MNLLSSQNKILLKLIFLQASLIYSEFPVSKNINNVTFLPEQQVLTEIQTIATKTLQQRHSQLRKQITSTEENDKRNYFACCFVFKLPEDQEIEVPLLYKFIIKKRRFELAIPQNTIKALTVKLQQTNNITFVSHQPNPAVYVEIKALHESFLDSVLQDNAAAKNQAMLLKTIDNRSVGGGRIINAVSNAMRSTDSEAAAIYVLQQKYVIDNIIEEIKQYLGSITSIEFYGCTTRDMCALCFTNMNIIQYLSYKQQTFGFSFLGYLKQRIQEKNSQAPCSTKIFISSFQPSNGNLNFNSENLAPNCDNSCVYQFRIDPLCQ